jgi:hypothetical protein
MDAQPLFNLPSDDVVRTLSKKYRDASPFQHVVLDGILDSRIDGSTAEFPELGWAGWSQFQDGYQFGKRVCNDITRFPTLLRELCIEAGQPRFLQFLEKLTGIPHLIPDPYLSGGGLHSSGEGGILAPHTDFHIYDQLALYRRINLILYFNEGWAEGDGGALELSRKGSSIPSASVVPIFGRMVIFNTDDISVHGFSKPIAKGKRRNSLALYYYTSQEVGVYSGDRTTHWQTHGSRSVLHVTRVKVYQTLIFASRVLSKLAHIANPNMGNDTRSGVTSTEDGRH